MGIYLRLLVKLYRFLARRTESRFNKIILKRLFMSRKNRPPLSIARIKRNIRKQNNMENKIVVCVGNVTNDTRIYKVPKITLCALHVTEKCRERILAAGGEIITFDQLALRAPDGKHTLLLQGPRSKRVAQRRFGAAGLPGSHVKPLVRSKGPHMVSQEAHTASQGLHMVSQSPHTVSPSPMVRVVIWVDIFEALIQCNLSMDNNLNTNLNRVTIKVNPSKVNTLDSLSRANTNLTRITIQVNLSKVNTLVSLSRTNTNHIKVNTQGSLSRANTTHSRTNANHSRTNTNHSRTNTNHSRANTP